MAAACLARRRRPLHSTQLSPALLHAAARPWCPPSRLPLSLPWRDRTTAPPSKARGRGAARQSTHVSCKVPPGHDNQASWPSPTPVKAQFTDLSLAAYRLIRIFLERGAANVQ